VDEGVREGGRWREMSLDGVGGRVQSVFGFYSI